MVVGACLGIATPALAAPGDLDPSYGTGGRVDRVYSHDTAFAPDGSLYTVVSPQRGPDVVVKRLSDGQVDQSYGSDGQAEVGSTGIGEIYVVPDGSVITGSGSQKAFTISRLLPSGQKDPSFGAAGPVAIPSAGIRVYDVAQDAAGRVYATTIEDKRIVVLFRFNADGTRDTTFGDKGKVVVGAGFGAHIVPVGDGTLVGITSQSPTGSDMTVVEFTATGDLDPAYGSGGRAAIDFAEQDYLAGLTVDAEGRAILVGRGGAPDSEGRSGKQPAVVRLTTTGQLDASFGVDGFATQVRANGHLLIPEAVTVDPLGRPILAGTFGDGVRHYAGVARLRPDGTPDTAFGTRGVMGVPYDEAMSVGTLADSRIAVAGEISLYRVLTANGPADADADGHLDNADLCPLAFAQRGSGCPSLQAKISIGASFANKRLYGEVRGDDACVFSSKKKPSGRYKVLRLTIHEVRNGHDRVIGHDKTYDIWDLDTKLHSSSGYYASIPGRFDPVDGKCDPARSRTVRVTDPNRS